VQKFSDLVGSADSTGGTGSREEVQAVVLRHFDGRLRGGDGAVEGDQWNLRVRVELEALCTSITNASAIVCEWW
jgi:hypothetical protein